MKENNEDINGYKIIKKIGPGGITNKYLALKNNKNYVLKEIRKMAIDIDKNEIEKMRKNFDFISKINCKNIIKHYESFIKNNTLYIVTEYGGNSDLKEFIREHKYNSELIEEKIIENIIIQICSGLKEIHKNNIIHRDINPSNIFIDNNKVKIGGFGVCKVLEGNEQFADDLLGTYYYMAPEIVKNEKYNCKVDIYSLGCIIYELFTLNEYFRDKQNMEEKKVCVEIYNPKWQELIDQLLEEDYNKRPDIDKVLKFVESICDKDIKKENLINENEDSIEEINYERIPKPDYSTKSILKEAIDYGDQTKREIIKDKKDKNENLVNEDDFLKSNYLYYNLEKIATENPTKEEQLYVLCLFSKIIKSKGIETAVYKNDEKIICDDSIIQLLCCGFLYKYDFIFDFGKEKNKKILEGKEEYENLCKTLKIILSRKLNLDWNNILLSLPKKGSSKISVAFITPGVYEEKNLESSLKNIEEIKELQRIHRTVLIEGCKLSTSIFDQKGNNKDPFWGKDEKRGGEDYIPPLGWIGYGLKVENKFDNGNNNWLSYWNSKNEYAIAYFPIRNYYEDSEEIKKLTQSLANLNLMDVNSDSFYEIFENEDNIGKIKKGKCGKGIYLYQDIKIAEKQASIVDVNGVRYKILIMCRVNPNKIRIPEKFPNVWILNSDSFEIRQYRILIKIEVLTPIAEKTFKVETKPGILFKEIITKKDKSFFESDKLKPFREFDEETKKYIYNEQEAIIRLYTGNNFSIFNTTLIKGKIQKSENSEYSEEEIKSFIWCLHSILRNYSNDVILNSTKIKPVKDGITVYRRADITFDVNKYNIGSQFYFSNFISTSKKKDGYIGNHILEITIRNNEKNNYCYSIKDLSLYDNEDEVLITAYTSFFIKKIREENGYKIVEIECIGYVLDDKNVDNWP